MDPYNRLSRQASVETFETCQTSCDSPESLSPHVRDPDAFDYTPTETSGKLYSSTATIHEPSESFGRPQTPVPCDYLPSNTRPERGLISSRGPLHFSTPTRRACGELFDRDPDSEEISLAPEQHSSDHSDAEDDPGSRAWNSQVKVIREEGSSTPASTDENTGCRSMPSRSSISDGAASPKADPIDSFPPPDDFREWEAAAEKLKDPHVWNQSIWSSPTWGSRFLRRVGRSRTRAFRSHDAFTFGSFSSKLSQAGRRLLSKCDTRKHQWKMQNGEGTGPTGSRQSVTMRRRTLSREQTGDEANHKWHFTPFRKSRSSLGVVPYTARHWTKVLSGKSKIRSKFISGGKSHSWNRSSMHSTIPRDQDGRW